MKETKALYAFSADPITNGHINIVERISKTFQKVIVAIGQNPKKKYMYSLGKRVELAKQSLSHLENIEVLVAEGMLVDFAYSQGAQVIVKGVRNSTDFDYEQTLHMVGESQKLGIETYILYSEPHLAHVSSSTVKAIQAEHGDIRSFVPFPVKASLEDKVSNQIIIGITGGPACGKSTVTDELVRFGNNVQLPIHNLDLDKIGHQIYDDLTLPMHLIVRDNLVAKFGESILDDSESDLPKINRKALAEIVFNDKDAMKYLNEQVQKPMDILVRKFLKNKKGIILMNGALLAEGRYLSYCNNRVFVISANYEDQIDRMKQRGLTEKQVFARLDSQLDTYHKLKIIQEVIDSSGFGFVHDINTSNINLSQIPLEIIGSEDIQVILKGFLERFNLLSGFGERSIKKRIENHFKIVQDMGNMKVNLK